MANSHDLDSSGPRQTRRSYLRLASVAAAVGTGATVPVAATPKVVELGEAGLTTGEVIDDYLETYLTDNTELRIPAGEYDWNGEGFTGATENAAVIGDGEVLLNNTAGEYYELISAESGTIELKNFTVRGVATGEGSRFRLEAAEEATIVVENVNFPDGSEAGAKAKAFYAPGGHAGTLKIHDCYIAGFDDNGIYANSPGDDDGAGGQVRVTHCVAHNNNISGIRIGSDNSSVEHCLVLNDEPAPESRNGTVNQRGIRVRSDGDDISIADCTIVHRIDGVGAPIQLHRGAEGGSGTISNVRIHNDADSTAIEDQDGETAADWEAKEVTISGEDRECPSHFDADEVTTEPRIKNPQRTPGGWI